MVPVTVNVPVPEQQVQEYDVPVTVMVPKQVTETVPVTTTVSVPEQRTDTVPTTQYRQVTENDPAVRRQRPCAGPRDGHDGPAKTGHRKRNPAVSVAVPVQVPVTVMTTQQKQVTDNVTQQCRSRFPCRCR